jgi:hypothetical protein
MVRIRYKSVLEIQSEFKVQLRERLPETHFTSRSSIPQPEDGGSKVLRNFGILPQHLLTYLLTYLLTHSFHGARYYFRNSTCEKISRFLMETEGSSPCSQKPPLDPIQSQLNPVHPIDSYLRSSLMLSSHLRLGLPSGLLPSGLPTKTL